MIEIEKQLTQLISSLPKISKADVVLEHPSNPDYGDYSSNVAMRIFSALSDDQRIQLQVDSPRELAFSLVTKLDEKLESFKDLQNFVLKIEVAGPGFINFYLSPFFFISSLFESIKGENYGKSTLGKNVCWEIEHTSPNPNKAMHLGHLRNNLIGMTLYRLWQAVGIKVISEEVDNNRGIAIAKLMWGYLKFARKNQEAPVTPEYWIENQDQWLSPEEMNLRPDLFVDQLYVKASEDFENNSEVEKVIRNLVVEWENKNITIWALWQKVLNYSYQGQLLTLNRLENHWDHIWHEHEHYQLGKDLVDEGLEKGIFVKLDDGAIISNLESYGLTDTVIKKSDDTSLYITQDLALTKLKIQKHGADKYHWVVGPEQKLALSQMFAVCEQLGIAKLSQLEHISYGYMSIKGQGKMSSRTGNVLYIDQLLDLAKERAKDLIKSDLYSSSQVEKMSEAIGVGAVKYAILKVGRASDMAFDLESALSLEGNSGPYLQYTHARASSILRKSSYSAQSLQELLDQEGSEVSEKLLEAYNNTDSRGVLQSIYQFPSIIISCANNNEPSTLATFLYQLAQSFNSFYNHQQVLVDDENDRLLRLLITASTSKVLKTGLELLGIEALEEM